jgi:hypothetical protein
MGQQNNLESIYQRTGKEIIQGVFLEFRLLVFYHKAACFNHHRLQYALKKYTLEIFKSKCQSDAKGVHCFAHLEQDVSKVLPYLRVELNI